MNEPKPFASLSSSLLARKGHAKPAMRPQSFHMVPGPGPQDDPFNDDLGWNDMGHEQRDSAPADLVPLHADVPAIQEDVPPPPVVEQQEMLAREFPAPERETVKISPVQVSRPLTSGKVRAAPGSKGKAAFTLRLDAERHLRLRLVCAVNHRSAQQIVTLALDEYLERQPDNAALTVRTTN